MRLKRTDLLRKVSWVPMTAVGLAMLVVGVFVLGAGRSAAQSPGAANPIRIEVNMSEFSFSPQPLRIPAGRPVTLVIRNTGKLAHEFMAGREPHEGAFEQDLFAGVQVNIQKQVSPAGRSAAPSSPTPHAEPEHAQGQEHAPAAGGQEHAAGKPRGTMVAAEAGDTYLMSFTLPAARRGEWMSGCFLKVTSRAGCAAKSSSNEDCRSSRASSLTV